MNASSSLIYLIPSISFGANYVNKSVCASVRGCKSQVYNRSVATSGFMFL
jgi:hypothetical protein